MFNTGNTIPSSWDINFRLFKIPVRITPFFWLFAVLFSPFLRMEMGDMRTRLLALTAWCLAWFLTFLVHEFGHALVLSKIFGARPWVVFGFGGWTLHDPFYRRIPGRWGRVLISFAGPASEIFSALLIAGILILFGCVPILGFDKLGGFPIPYLMVEDIYFWIESPGSLMQFFMGCFLYSFLIMSFFWGFLNLLPIYPMDGGQIAREIFIHLDPQKGLINSLWLSIIFAGSIAFFCFMQQNFFIALFFIFFAYMNFQQISALSRR